MPPRPPSSHDRLLLALRLKYPPDLSRAQKDLLAERMRRTGTSLVFAYWVLMIGGIIDLVAAAVTKRPGYFLLGVVLTVGGYALSRHVRAVREVLGPKRR